MTEEYEQRKSERATRMVNDALQEMHRRRSEYRRARRMGSVTHNMQATFQSAVVDVYDELSPYRGRVDEQWSKYDVEKIHLLDNETISRQEVDTQGGRIDVKTIVEPYRIPCQNLLEWSKVLDDIARDLGFSAPFGLDTADLDEAEV